MKELDKDALLEEAIKRGYGKGIKIKAYFPEYSSAYSDNREYIMNDCKPSYEEKEKAIRMGGSIIYHKGKWAEIVEESKVETKFEKGKWYKINNAWYAKHECIHGSGRYWRHGDRITIHGNFCNELGNLGNNWKDVSIVLLEDLSEIQQYLPDRHPDKFTTPIAKEEFVLPEKWCIRSTESTASVIYEWLNKHATTGIYYDNLGSVDKNSYVCFPVYGSWHQNRGGSDYIEITFEQFKKYVLKEEVRKALPHEIPVENSVKQYPYTPEESFKLDFEVKWKEPRYIGGVDSISAFSCGIFEQMKKQSPQSRKTPDLIDKTKVKVEIKRTKVKQIKL